MSQAQSCATGMQDLGQAVFVQSAGPVTTDAEVSATGPPPFWEKRRSSRIQKTMHKRPVKHGWTVRSFGQVFAGLRTQKGISIGVRGPVSVHQGVSVSPCR